MQFAYLISERKNHSCHRNRFPHLNIIITPASLYRSKKFGFPFIPAIAPSFIQLRQNHCSLQRHLHTKMVTTDGMDDNKNKSNNKYK